MNSLDQLLNQSEALLKVIDQLISLIQKTLDGNGHLSKRKFIVLKININKTLNFAKLFMKNYNEFMENYVEQTTTTTKHCFFSDIL